MKEIEHEDIFSPPEGTQAIVIPTSGESQAHPPATFISPMDSGYSMLAKARWPGLDINLGVLFQDPRLGIGPHPLTRDQEGQPTVPGVLARGSEPPAYHLIALPTRPKLYMPITIDWLCLQLRRLVQLCNTVAWLKEGNIVLPQLTDATGPTSGLAWRHLRGATESWLDSDRYIVISGLGHRT